MKDLSDSVVIARLKSAQESERSSALRYLYRTHFPLILGFVKKNRGTASDAEDLFQEGMITFYRQIRLENLEIKKNIQSYLYTICRNQWLKKLRTIDREIELVDQHEYIPDLDNTLSHLIKDEQTQNLAQLIEQLGDACKQIILLYYYERLSMKQIAQAMGYSGEQVAKNKKSKCLRKLREKCQDINIFTKLIQ